MNITYCFSSPEGDISLSPADLAVPFKIAPQKNHPYLLLRDYFKALEVFFLLHNKKAILDVTGFEEIEKLIIRSEKHGAFYHIASADIFCKDEMSRVGLCTAVSKTGKSTLAREFETISSLNRESSLPFLPRAFAITEVTTSYGEQGNTVLVALTEWLENYHEWHLYQGEGGREQQIIIWDQQRGYRVASDSEAGEIFRQASKILTLYYDPVTHCQIYPWHNAAGDFIIKTGDSTKVKLTTVRGYKPVTGPLKTGIMSPIIAVIYFFLNLTIRMRLDRQEGTGELIWAEEQYLNPVITGFFEGLTIKEKENKGNSGEIKKLPRLLRAFSSEELIKLLDPLLSLYEQEDTEEFLLIRKNLRLHALELHRLLQSE